MTVGKNKKIVIKKKAGKKKIVDPFSRKDWYDIKAPSAMFQNKDVGKTIVTRSAGMRDAKDSLRGRVFSVSLADLKKEADDDSYRKFSLRCEEIQGKSVLTNFCGMSITRDKLCSLIRKKQTMIESFTDVKTSDGYLLRLFVIGFTKKRLNQRRQTSYAQSAQVRAIRKKMVEIIANETKDADVTAVVQKLIPEIIGQQIEKACQGIYPLQNVFIRRVKTLRAPKFDVQKLMDLHGGAAAVAADVGMQVDGPREEIVAEAAPAEADA